MSKSTNLLKLLHQRPISYYPIYRQITGSTTAGILLSFLTQTFISEGVKHFSKADLMKLTSLTISEIETSIKKINDFVVIKSLSDEDVFKLLNKNNALDGCLFCGYNKTYLDKHHYPIRKKHGGIETICLCANCHREFHYLSDFKKMYIPKKEIITQDFIDFVKELNYE